MRRRPSCSALPAAAADVRFRGRPHDARDPAPRARAHDRPDDAPAGDAPDDEAFRQVVDAIRRDPGGFEDVDTVCARAGYDPTTLNELFREHHHTTPDAFLNGARIAAARRLLATTKREPGDIAGAVGYESRSSFQDHFRTSAAMTPAAYRALGDGRDFILTLPAGYRAADPLGMLGRDPASPTERVEGLRAAKAIRVDGTAAVLRLAFRDDRVRCRVDAPAPLSPHLVRAAYRIALRMLGLGPGADPVDFERGVAETPGLERLTEGRAGLRVPLTGDVFEALSWAIIGQQINLTFASALRRSLIELCGAPAGGEFRAHPDAHAVARLDYGDLTARRFSRRKAEYLIDTARLLASGALALERLGDRSARRVERRLLEVRGIGPWTAQYVMLRGFGFADCVPVGDSGLSEALRRFFDLPARPDRERTLSLMRPFTPYRSLATAHFWAYLASSDRDAAEIDDRG